MKYEWHIKLEAETREGLLSVLESALHSMRTDKKPNKTIGRTISCNGKKQKEKYRANLDNIKLQSKRISSY
mgnify:CR=1 FL=1